MSLAFAKKPSHSTHLKKRVSVHSVLNRSHPIRRSSPLSLIQRKPHCPCDGGCPRCEGIIQPKLKIGQPNDKYEQEADRVADQVMRIPEPAVQTKPT